MSGWGGFRDPGYGRRTAGDQATGGPRGWATGSGGETPWYSRPRGENPAGGSAVPRSEYTGGPAYPGSGGSGGSGYANPGGWGYAYAPGYWGGGYYGGFGSSNWGYYPYWGYGTWGLSYAYPWGLGAFGLGYFYYDQAAWNYYGGSYLGSYAGPYGYSGYDMGGASSGGSVGYSGKPMGGLRLKVKPATASVFVDGYFAGRVDDFDGFMQKLNVELGTHKIEISAPGYKPLIVEVTIRDWDTKSYEGQLEPIR
ncbi:MAG: PEGA domain-containing protein [Acidobacteria bacterium]|nr:PEGA domain-containing protein [Acidobacteriota bacterium]